MNDNKGVPQQFLHVLLLREGAYWVMQALEYDLGAQGPTVALAEKAFICNLKAQAQLDIQHGRQPFAMFRPAPKDVWDAFVTATHLKTVPVDLGIGVGIPPYMIQAEAEPTAAPAH